MTPLHVAAAYGCKNDSELYELLMGDHINALSQDGATPLFTAAMHGRSSNVAALAKLGASVDLPNALGVTPMHAAALKGDANSIRVLAQNGANVNAADALGETPLHAAAKCEWDYRSGNNYAPAVLVQLGANISAVSTKGKTPLFVAAALGHEKWIDSLAGSRTDKNLVDVPAKGGVTPLLIAAQNNHLKAVTKLLECGADVNARADDGRTPLSVALLCAPGGDVVRALRLAIAMRIE